MPEGLPQIKSVEPWRHPRLTAVLAGLVVLVLILLPGIRLKQEELQNRARPVAAEADLLARRLVQDLEARLAALSLPGSRLRNTGAQAGAAFADEAGRIMELLPGFLCLARIDAAADIEHLHLRPGSQEPGLVQGLVRQHFARVIHQAAGTRQAGFTAPFGYGQGYRGLGLFVPYFVGGQYAGGLVAVLDLPVWFFQLLGRDLPGVATREFAVRLELDGQLLLERGTSPGREDRRFARTATSMLAGTNGSGGSRMAVTCTASTAWSRGNRTWLPELAYVMGMLLVVTIALLVFLYQKSRKETWKARIANLSLEQEIQEHAHTSETLVAEQRRLAAIIDATYVGTWEWKLATGQVFVNERWAAMIGYTAAELSPVPEDIWTMLGHPDDRPGLEDQLARHFAGELEFLKYELRLRHKDGYWVWVLFQGKIILRDRHGQPLLVSGTHQDISDRKAAEIRLRESEERYRSILASMDDLVIVLDHEGRFLEFNLPSGEAVNYLPVEAYIGKAYKEVLPRSISAQFEVAFRDLQACGMVQQVEYSFRQNRRMRWYQAKLSMRQDLAGNFAGVTIVSREITERREYEDRIRYLANHDTLTGLPSLRLVRDRLAMALMTAERKGTLVAVFFLDLDGFKPVNDTWGHDVGDLVLKEVARRLAACIRKMDTVGRVGGDEFLLVLEELETHEVVHAIAAKLLEAIKQPIRQQNMDIGLTASIGIAFYPQDGRDPGSLIKQADTAMYGIKNRGRNGAGLYEPGPAGGPAPIG